MTPAETLQAAADKLDALLAEVTPGPWATGGEPIAIERGGDLTMVGVEARWVAGVWPEPAADAAWIETMDPVVGRALVAVLRHAATLIVQTNPTDSAVVYRHELELARAILAQEAS